MSSSPPYGTILLFTAVMQVLIGLGMIGIAVTQYRVWRRQTEIRRMTVEHRRQHEQLNETLAGTLAAPHPAPNLTWRCPACGQTGEGHTNAPAAIRPMSMPCPICGVQVELKEVGADAP